MILPIACLGQVQDVGTARPPVTAPIDSSRTALAPPARIPDSALMQVRGRLKLTDAQQPFWSDYVVRIDNYNKVYYQETPVSSLNGESAPHQIARFIDNLQNRLAVLDEIERSTKALYDVLDAGQKQVADQFLFSTIPIFASSLGAAKEGPTESKPRRDKPEGSQHKRRAGGSLGGMGQ